MAKRFHYTYRLRRKHDGAFYIGVRSSTCHPTEDTAYMSSSKLVNDEIKAGVVYTKKILVIWGTRKEALAHEIALHMIHDVAVNPKFLNRARQTATGFDRSRTVPWNKGLKGSQEAWNKGIPMPKHLIEAQSKRQKGRRCSEDTKLKIKSYWTDERRSMQSYINSGSLNPRYGCKVSAETKAKMSKGWTQESREKKRAWARANSPSKRPEIAAKISAALRGKPRPVFSHPKYPDVRRVKNYWSVWAKKNLPESRFHKFMSQLTKE